MFTQTILKQGDVIRIDKSYFFLLDNPYLFIGIFTLSYTYIYINLKLKKIERDFEEQNMSEKRSTKKSTSQNGQATHYKQIVLY